MNKKLLIGTALASTLLLSSICIPKTFAAQIEGNGAELTSCINKLNGDTESDLALYVVLPNKTHEFTKADLVDLIQKRYKGDFIIESIKKSDADNQGITDDNEKVGTGIKVTLKSKTEDTEGEKTKELTVVLYGDVNGNGIVNSNDARDVARHSNKSKIIEDKAKLKAANIANLSSTTEASENINASDARRIQQATVELLNNKAIVDEVLYPGELQEVVDLDERISDVVDAINNVEGNSDKLILAVDPDDNVVDFGLVTGDESSPKKLSEYIGAGTQLISKLQEQLKDEKLSEITLKLGQKTSTLKANATNEDIIKTACELLCEACKDCEGVTDDGNVNLEKLKNVEVSTLIGQKLEATFKIKNDNSEFTDGTTEQKYTIVFTNIIKEENVDSKVKEAIEELAKKETEKSENAYFDISMEEDNSVNIKIKKGDQVIQEMTETGIKEQLKKLVENLNVRTVDVVYDGITYEVYKMNEKAISAALELVKKMCGDKGSSECLKSLIGEKLEVTVKFDNVIEETGEAEKTYTVNFTSDNTSSLEQSGN